MSAVEFDPAATGSSASSDVYEDGAGSIAVTSDGIPQELTANADLLEKHVPVGASVPTDADLKAWLKGFTSLRAISSAATARGHVANSTQFVMACLMYWYAKNPKFTDELTAAGFRIPSSKKEFACAASFIYGLDTADVSNKNAASKRVNSLGSQYEGLLRELGKSGLRPQDFDFGRDSVRRLLVTVTKAGGTNALERVTKDGSDNDDPKPIPLSAQRQRELLYDRGVEALSDKGEPTFRMPLEAVRPDGSVVSVGEAAQSDIKAVVARTAPPLRRALALAETLMMGGCVLVEPSSQLKKQAADPNDPNSEKRPDERQVVFHKDGRITQSLLLASSSVVVETVTHDTDIILGDRVQGHTRLYTEKRKQIEENLKDDRLRVFDIGVSKAGPDTSTGVGRLVIFTEAASGDTERQSVDALLQRLSGPIPLDVDLKTLVPEARCEIVPSILNADAGPHSGSYATNAEKLVKQAAKAGKGKPVVRPEVSVSISDKGFTLKSPADTKPVTLPVSAFKDAGSITVRLDDFVVFLQTYAKVHSEVTSNIVCWMGEAVLCFEITTYSAEHRVFIPKSVAGHRSDRSIVKIKNQKWPEGQFLNPNNFD